MPVSAIFENIEAGASINDIMEWFEFLDREQVKAVIEFAAHSLDRAPALPPQGDSLPGRGVDHVVPLKRGGQYAPENMQWQMTAEAKARDKIE